MGGFVSSVHHRGRAGLGEPILFPAAADVCSGRRDDRDHLGGHDHPELAHARARPRAGRTALEARSFDHASRLWGPDLVHGRAVRWRKPRSRDGSCRGLAWALASSSLAVAVHTGLAKAGIPRPSNLVRRWTPASLNAHLFPIGRLAGGRSFGLVVALHALARSTYHARARAGADRALASGPERPIDLRLLYCCCSVPERAGAARSSGRCSSDRARRRNRPLILECAARVSRR